MYINTLKDKLKLGDQELELIFDKAIAGGEARDKEEIEKWARDRFLPNCVIISKEEYARMCVSALKIIPHVAATDYGSSRQRDMGQLWADMIRGYLGEAAFLKFLKSHWNIDADLGHEKGFLEEYLPMDIHEVIFPGKPPRPPNLKISVKATKWNGIWLDIPGDQFNHSDIHLLVKVGVGRDHLFAFFKEISVFRDKVLKIGEEVGSLTRHESAELYDSLPSFKPIPAYICGFVRKTGDYNKLPYAGKKGRKNYTITAWNGPILSGDLEKIKNKEAVAGSVKFSGIGEFSHDQGFLFNTGNLLWKKTDWDAVVKSL
ncbi:hypothetical protein HY732_02835 [Candidatus Uhrbacteria bacterium]|nr:hypothetical protein [Candidatus Uhrbacteria bacterium]